MTCLVNGINPFTYFVVAPPLNLGESPRSVAVHPQWGVSSTVMFNDAGRTIVDDVSDNHIFTDYTRSQEYPCRGDSGEVLFIANGREIGIVGVVSQSDPSVDVDDIYTPGDRTLYTSVRDPSVAAFIRANVTYASFQ